MLLDSSFLIDRLEGRPGAIPLAAELDREGDRSRTRLPAPVPFERWRGAARTVRRQIERRRIEERLAAYEPVESDREDARSAGLRRAVPAGAGEGLGTIDLPLAGRALARTETRVTEDRTLAPVRHRVPVRTSARRPGAGRWSRGRPGRGNSVGSPPGCTGSISAERVIPARSVGRGASGIEAWEAMEGSWGERSC